MKTMTLLISLVAASAQAFACKPGYVPTDTEGVCVEETAQNPTWTSDEKPPEDKMPSWQREGIVLVNCPELSAQDIKADQERALADAQGKQMAGIRPK